MNDEPNNWVTQLQTRLIWDHKKDGTELKSDEKEMCRLVGDLSTPPGRKANAMKHYCKLRHLTIRERGQLQSFPDDYKFVGRPTEKSRQIDTAFQYI
jgi:site-specific DNA-cytosine methylase